MTTKKDTTPVWSNILEKITVQFEQELTELRDRATREEGRVKEFCADVANNFQSIATAATTAMNQVREEFERQRGVIRRAMRKYIRENSGKTAKRPAKQARKKV